MKLFIFWASYLYLPFVLGSLILALRKRGLVRGLAILAILASSVLAYARFVEPRILTVEHADIVLPNANEQSPEIRLALIADTHFGIFTNAMPMKRILSRINQEAPDAVFIAGDFLYHLPPEKIPAALAPLADARAPVFAVLGNHDVGHPGPIYTSELYTALDELGVTLVENRAEPVELNGQDVLIAGTSDLWEREQDYAFSAGLSAPPYSPHTQSRHGAACAR